LLSIVSMKILAVALALVAALAAGCARHAGVPGPAAGGAGSPREATSPTVASDEAPSALPARVLYRAREFRGNPVPLGVLTGAVLVVALGLGVVTLLNAYRR
jgi:hypothetical protein